MKTSILKYFFLVLTSVVLVSCSKNEENVVPENLIEGQWQLTKLVVNGEVTPLQCSTPWTYNFNEKSVKITISLPTVNNCDPGVIQYNYTLEDKVLTFTFANIVTETNTINKLTSQELVYTKNNGNVLYFSKK